jgi:hypothetical protein
MILLGLCGKKYSGKDTMADYLVEYHGFQKMSFAAPLKEACRHLFFFSEEQCHDPRRKDVVDRRWNISPRQAFQMVGTDWIRNQFHSHFWVERMRFELEECSPESRIVVSDVRFENEKDFVVELGGHVCGIHRPSLSASRTDLHESEINMDSFFVNLPLLSNDSSLDDFYRKIDAYLNDILAPL